MEWIYECKILLIEKKQKNVSIINALQIKALEWKRIEVSEYNSDCVITQEQRNRMTKERNNRIIPFARNHILLTGQMYYHYTRKGILCLPYNQWATLRKYVMSNEIFSKLHLATNDYLYCLLPDTFSLNITLIDWNNQRDYFVQNTSE